jgi:hypothetical protein
MIKKAVIVLSISMLFIVLLNFLKPNTTGFFLEKSKENIINPSFEETRPENSSLFLSWYVKKSETYDIEVGNDFDSWNWYWSPISMDGYFGNYSLFYNVTKNNELSDSTFIKSNVFDIEKRNYKLVFYTKPNLSFIGKVCPNCAVEIDFVTLDNNNNWKKYWYLMWNNNGITYYWDKEISIKPSFEDIGDGWKKITVDMDLSSLSPEITKATIYFASSSLSEYDGYFLIDYVLLSEVIK